MLQRLGHAALIAVVALLGGALGARVAQGLAQAPAPADAVPLHAVSSATGLQSFLWALNGDGRTVIFCFSTGSPDTGPQYDFDCKSKRTSDAIRP